METSTSVRSGRVHSLATEIFLSVKLLDNGTLVPQFWLPRPFRNMGQASQVDLVEGKGALQSLSLEAVMFLSECASSFIERAHLDVCLHAPPNLLREFATHDWFSSCVVI